MHFNLQSSDFKLKLKNKHINRNESKVVFDGFELSRCSFLTKELFNIMERSSLRLENMNMSFIESN